MEAYETDYELEEEAADPEDTEGSYQEEPEADPEGYDLSDLQGEQLDVEQIVQAVERQSDIMTAGFTCTCFMLGILAGALVITGFRLRRV